MHFDLIDRVLERHPDRLVAVKSVSRAEEYLQDHFPSYPVLPGVFMIETLVQACRALAADRGWGTGRPLVLGGVRALKYGAFVRPGDRLRVEVTLDGEPDPATGAVSFRGRGERVPPEGVGDGEGETKVAVSGRLTLRPLAGEPAPVG